MSDIIKTLRVHGYSIYLGSAVKRMEEDFYVRTVWRLSKNDRVYECPWEGYATDEAAFIGLEQKLNELLKAEYEQQ